MKTNQTNKKFMPKKASMTVVQFILSLIVMLVIIFAVKDPLYASTDNLWGYGDKLFGTTQPVQKGLNDENVTRQSIAALVEGINRAANMEMSYSENNLFEKPSTYAPISYNVTFHAKVKLKETDSGVGSLYSKSLDKSFTDTFYQSHESFLSEEWFVFSDFNLDDDQAKDYAEFYENTRKSHPTITTQAPVKQLNEIYNLELVATYSNGEKCRVKTYVEEGKPFSTELTSADDLKTWGKWGSVCKSLSGCDRNGNGVPGSFSTDDIGKDAKILFDTFLTRDTWDKIVKNGLTNRFPNGKVTVDSGEECLDSPTWMECPGMRLYYCGKYGSQSGQSKTLEDKDYFINAYNWTHSRTGIRFVRIFDEKFTGESNTSKIEEAIAASGSDKKEGTNGFAVVKRDKLLLSSVHDRIFSYLSDSKTQNPIVSCNDGEAIGNSLLKCNMYGCNLCNFELKQKNVDQSYAWIYANLDPEYLIYYRALSPLPERAWAGSVLTSLSPSSLIMGPKYQEKSDQELADEIKIYLQKIFDLNNQNMMQPNSIRSDAVNEAILFSVFKRSETFLHSADQMISEKIFEKASKVSDILIADPSTDEIEEIMRQSNYSEYIEFARSQPQITFPTIYSFSLFFAMRDEMNKKLYPHGDEIVIKQPFEDPIISSQFLTSSIGLSEESQKYNIRLGKGNGKSERFYLASPCKADLKIIRTKCALSDEELAQSKDGLKTVDCIEIIPIMDGTVKNFCYSSGVIAQVWWWPNFNYQQEW